MNSEVLIEENQDIYISNIQCDHITGRFTVIYIVLIYKKVF